MTNTVNEKSPLYITVIFKNEDGDSLVPTTVDWRLDDRESDSEIVDWTSLGTPAASMSLVLEASNNLIVSESSTRERRALGIRVDDGLSTEAHQEFQYYVQNLLGPTGA